MERITDPSQGLVSNCHFAGSLPTVHQLAQLTALLDLYSALAGSLATRVSEIEPEQISVSEREGVSQGELQIESSSRGAKKGTKWGPNLSKMGDQMGTCQLKMGTQFGFIGWTKNVRKQHS